MEQMKTDKKKLLVFPNDPLIAYSEKGEIKPRYYNPCNYFDEVHIITFIDKEVEVSRVQTLAGTAKLFLYPVGNLKKTLLSFSQKKKELLALAKDIQPDMIRTFNPLFQGYFGTWLGKQLNIPVVTSLHGDYREMRWYPYRLFGVKGVLRHFRKVFLHQTLFCIYSLLLERQVLRNSDAVICVSAFLKQYAKEKGAKRMEVIYNRVDTHQFHPAKNPLRTNAPLHILTVGRLGRQKDQLCLIEAIQGLEVTLTVVGKQNFQDNYRAMLKTKVEELGLQHRVQFIEAIPNAKIPQLYADADIFAIATHYEGFCIPILEAMASGLPVVASNKAPLPEVGGDGGLFVDITPTAFRNALQKLINSPVLRKKLATAGRKRALALRGALMEKKEMELYVGLLKKRENNRNQRNRKG